MQDSTTNSQRVLVVNDEPNTVDVVAPGGGAAFTVRLPRAAVALDGRTTAT